MPLAPWVAPIELFVCTGFVVGFDLLHRLQGKKRLGTFSIDPQLFVAGKLAMNTSWGFLFAKERICHSR
jgi:hypothetical protein